jgi:thiopeptide-type bacteriocin biosynthesis protein
MALYAAPKGVGSPALALAAANAAAITAAFTGTARTGMRWLTQHIPPASPARLPRELLDEARRVADPGGNWAGLRAAPGGDAITRAWASRDRALAAYRSRLEGPGGQGIAPDEVLSSLIHVNFVRGYQIDFDQEAAAMYLARSAALAWTARNTQDRA